MKNVLQKNEPTANTELQNINLYFITNTTKQVNNEISRIIKTTNLMYHKQQLQRHGRAQKHRQQDAQLSQRDHAAGCVIVFAKSRRMELGDNILRTL